MSGFLLVPLDGGDPVQLPPGETVLGRGPFLGIRDSRVSRTHALLQNLDGRLQIKPLHQNPCFLQPSPAAPPLPLQRGRWQPLEDGHLLNLLPRALRFRVKAPPRADPDQEASGGATEGPRGGAGEGPRGGATEGPRGGAGEGPRGGAGEDGEAPAQTQTQTRSLNQTQTWTPTRTRVLPAWMMAAPPETQAPPPSAGRPQGAGPSREGAEPKQEGAGPQKRRKISPEEAKALPPAAGRQSKTSQSGLRDQDQDQDQDQDLDQVQDQDQGQDPDQDQGQDPDQDQDQDQVQDGPGEPGGLGQSEEGRKQTVVRTPCPYGRSCYRKNPLHFQECSHPGDPDYRDQDLDLDQNQDQDQDQDQDPDRPECPYGRACYRKNPQHRAEFSHPPPRAGRPPRGGPRPGGGQEEEEEEEEEEEDGGFLLEDSDDLDSDYQPEGSEDSP